MKSLLMNKLKKLTVVIGIALMLISCSNTGNVSNKQSNIPTPSVAVSETQGKDTNLRTNEVFDINKYEDKFIQRFFLLEADSKSGDAIFLRTPDGVTMLIDSGLKECSDQLVGYLKKLGVEKIDYIVASHLHSDHIGGFPAVINAFEIGKALVPNLPYDSSLNKRFQEALDKKNIEVEFLKDGDNFQFGQEVKVEVLSPEPEIVLPAGIVPEKSDAVTNNLSIVMKMSYKNKTFLFTGDIYTEREKKLVESKGNLLDVDVLKAPHHGANTSSSKAFIEAVSPKYTMFTTNSSFSMDVHNNYRDAGSDVYLTGIDGNILLVCDGDNISVITEKDRQGNYLK